MVFVSMAKLGYSEAEAFRMTPRKYHILFNEFLILNGVKKDGDEYAIDNMA